MSEAKFPRYSGVHTDDGAILDQQIEDLCPKCINGRIVESISLEFCEDCKHVTVDYWPRATLQQEVGNGQDK